MGRLVRRGRARRAVPARSPAARAAAPAQPRDRRHGRPDPRDARARGERAGPRPARPPAGRRGTGVAPSGRGPSIRPTCPPRSSCGWRRASSPRTSSPPDCPRERPAPMTRPWRRPYRLVGDPVLADPLRAQLVARGRPPGGGGARILVLGGAVDEMLADAFEARALDCGGPSWPDWLDVLAARDELAPRIDLAAVARAWARRTSPERVTLVLDAGRVARLVGVRRLTVPEPLAADAVDLARRVAAVLGLLVTQERRSALLRRTLAPRLRVVRGPRLAVPAAPAALGLRSRRADASPAAARWLPCCWLGVGPGLRLGRPRRGAPGLRARRRRARRPRRGPPRRDRPGAGPDPTTRGDHVTQTRPGRPAPRPAARRHPQDRHVVPPGRAPPQPRDPGRARHLLPRPTGSTSTSWRRST